MVAVTARDVMSREFVGVSEGDAVGDVLELMVEQTVDDVLVLRGNEPVGTVSCHDLLETSADDGVPDAAVESVMGPAPDPVSVEADVDAVLARLSNTVADQLPVTGEDGALVGVVTDADVIAAASSLLSEPRDAEGAVDAVGTASENGVDATVEGVRRTVSETGTTGTAAETSSQSVCEACGSLTGDLAVVNGQSICPECRDV